MNTKKVIEKLIKIADNQQKIINKLAQGFNPEELTPVDSPLGAENFNPNTSQKQPARALIGALPPNFFQQKLVNIEEHGKNMVVIFKPGQKTQENYDLILDTLQKLTDNGTITQTYNLTTA